MTDDIDAHTAVENAHRSPVAVAYGGAAYADSTEDGDEVLVLVLVTVPQGATQSFEQRIVLDKELADHLGLRPTFTPTSEEDTE